MFDKRVATKTYLVGDNLNFSLLSKMRILEEKKDRLRNHEVSTTEKQKAEVKSREHE